VFNGLNKTYIVTKYNKTIIPLDIESKKGISLNLIGGEE
jgi:hypothetical protein